MNNYLWNLSKDAYCLKIIGNELSPIYKKDNEISIILANGYIITGYAKEHYKNIVETWVVKVEKNRNGIFYFKTCTYAKDILDVYKQMERYVTIYNGKYEVGDKVSFIRLDRKQNFDNEMIENILWGHILKVTEIEDKLVTVSNELGDKLKILGNYLKYEGF